MDPSKALAAIPAGLRQPLLAEYRSIVKNFSEHKWSPSELSGGKFCEVVHTLLDGHAKGTYPTKPIKPKNFVNACRKLESNTGVPRSFQILIPRILPALYEVRNNRGVGHTGGEVNPNFMDASLVLSMSNWVMAELVRVFHNLSTEDAQSLVDSLAERHVPLIWQGEHVNRILDSKMKLTDQVLVFLAASPGPLKTEDLLVWTEYTNRSNFFRSLKTLHKNRLVELSGNHNLVELLPPGEKKAAVIIEKSQDR